MSVPRTVATCVKQVGALSAATAIINPAKLPRDRQLDICALCHAGIGESFTPPLSYTAGDMLGHYLSIPQSDPDARLEVHGGQWLRLTKF